MTTNQNEFVKTSVVYPNAQLEHLMCESMTWCILDSQGWLSSTTVPLANKPVEMSILTYCGKLVCQ